VDVDDAAVVDKGRGVVEQAFFRRALLDEADDGREVFRRGDNLAEARVLRLVEGDLLDEVLERVARQAELGEDASPAFFGPSRI
jgi:hypothetical protein